MIDKKLIPYGGLKKEPFSGTHHGSAISFAEMTEKAAQPSPYSFIQNHGALKIHRKKRKNQKTFPLSDEGMDEAIAAFRTL